MAEQVMLNYVEAMRSAVAEEMRRDKRIVIWGESIRHQGGIFTATDNLFNEFGTDRVLNTPIVESAIVDMAIGAAFAGLRPIASIYFSGFLPSCFDAVFSKLGSMRQEFGYHGPLPVVIHVPIAMGSGYGADHSASLEAILIHSPGLKVVTPSTAYDVKGLMKAAIRDDEPVVFMPHIGLYFGHKERIPSEDYIIPLGKADVKRKGGDITIATFSAMVHKALAAADALSKEGIDVEVVDLRSLVPLDVETIVKSVRKTGRLLIAHEAMKRGGVAGEIAFRVSEAAPDVVKTMKAPIKRLAAKNVALPHGVELEKVLVPQVDDIIKAIKEMV